MTLKIWSKQLLYIKPDDTPYLMASRNAVLGYSSSGRLIYLNTAHTINDTLSNQSATVLKFNINFKLNSTALTNSYEYLLRVPGLVDFINYNGRLAVKTSWLSYMYMLSTNSIEAGWNDISLVGDGTNVILTVNESSFVMAEQAYSLPLTLYNGFGGSNYIAINDDKFNVSASNWRMRVGIYTPSNSSSTRKTNYIFGPNNAYYTCGIAAELQYNSNGYYVMGYGLSSNGSSWNQGWVQNNDIHLAYSSWHWFLWVKTGSTINCYHSTDAINYELHTTKSIDADLYHSNNVTLSLGNTASNSSYYMRGYINITDTFFERNGTKTFDGITAIEGTDYTVQGSLTAGIYSRTDYRYPHDMHTGTLQVLKDPSEIKDINIIKVD